MIQWLKPKFKLWPLFANEFILEVDRINDKTFAETMKRLEKEFKHYGEKKNFKEIKRERLANDFLIF